MIGVVPRYPRTEEAFKRKQEASKLRMKHIRETLGIRPNRRGIPSGWRGRRKEADEARRIAAEQAQKVIEIMKREETLGEPVVDVAEPSVANEKALAEAALKGAIEIVLACDPKRPECYLYPVASRLVAARTVLEWTKAKPAQKVENTLKGAEDFLQAVLAQGENGAQ